MHCSSLDEYCQELLQNGNTKAIQDLLLCGYTDLVNQLKTDDETNEETGDFIKQEVPQLLVRSTDRFSRSPSR